MKRHPYRLTILRDGKPTAHIYARNEREAVLVAEGIEATNPGVTVDIDPDVHLAATA